jgi:malonate transporter and related proteins
VAVILPALVPIYFVLLLGFTAGKRGIVKRAHVGGLNTVVMSFALPASLLAATAATPRAAMLGQWPLLVTLVVAMMLIYPLWYLLQRRALRRSVRVSAIQSLTVALPNYAAAGLPIVTALLGPDHIVPVAVAIAAGSLFPSPITLALLELASGAPVAKAAGGGKPVGEPSAGHATHVVAAIGRAFLKPIVLAPAAGILISLAGWRLPTLATPALRQMGQVAGGLALFVTGLILSMQRFRLNGNVVLATIVVTVIQPLLAFVVARALGASADVLKMSVLMAALPSGFFGILFGANAGFSSEDSGAIVIASTVAGAGTLALSIAWLYG